MVSVAQRSSKIDYAAIYRKAHAENVGYQTNNMGMRLLDFWKNIPLTNPIIEIGCGNGQVCQYLQGRGFTISGSDVVPGDYERNYPFQLFDITKLPWPYTDRQFGTALVFDVFEHLESSVLPAVFCELLRVSRNQIISIPDYASQCGYHLTVLSIPQWLDWLHTYSSSQWTLIAVADRDFNHPEQDKRTGIFTRITV